MNTVLQSKICKVCHVKQPLTNFSKNSQLLSGISNRCKTCDKIKNGKRKRRKGFNWQDVAKKLSFSPEEEFESLYGGADVEHKGKLVMKKGKIIDDEWYQKKLLYIKEHV